MLREFGDQELPMRKNAHHKSLPNNDRLLLLLICRFIDKVELRLLLEFIVNSYSDVKVWLKRMALVRISIKSMSRSVIIVRDL